MGVKTGVSPIVSHMATSVYTYHFPQYSVESSCKENNARFDKIHDHCKVLTKKIHRYSQGRFVGGGLMVVAGLMHFAKAKRATLICVGGAGILLLTISIVALMRFGKSLNLLTDDKLQLRRAIARQLLGRHDPLPQDDSETAKHLRAVQSELDTRGIPLHVCPPRPTRQFTIDQANVMAYRNRLPLADQAKFDQLIPLMSCLSMREFEATLQACVSELNAYLDQHKVSEAYSVAMVAGKSLQWVASLAVSSLSVLPTSWLSLPHCQGTIGLNTPNVSKHFESFGNEKAVVLFDDCSWSGDQLMGNLNKLYANAPLHLQHVCLVIPYMSETAFQRASNWVEPFKKKGITLKVITGPEHFKTVGSVFDDEAFRELNADNHNIVGRLGFLRNQTLFLTEWRYPDNTSFPEGFGSTGMRLSETITVAPGDSGIRVETGENGQIEYSYGSAFLAKHYIAEFPEEDPTPLPGGGYELRVKKSLTPAEFFLPVRQDIVRPYGWTQVEADS